MTTIGFIGSGLMAAEVARLAITSGISVSLANSRGPQSMAALAAGLGPLARAADIQAAAEADVVVLALPLGRLRDLDPQLLAGHTVLDLTNYYPHRDGRIADLDSSTRTAGQYVQHHLRESRSVRAFSNISYLHIPQLARAAGAADRTALPLAGDDPQAKATVAELVDRLGFDTVDAGGLEQSWRFEPETAAYLVCYAPASTSMAQLQSAPAVPAGTSAIRALLDRAERTDQSSRTF